MLLFYLPILTFVGTLLVIGILARLGRHRSHFIQTERLDGGDIR